MRLKLDENFGARTRSILQDAGHDAQTVRDESLEGVSDHRLYEVCCSEQRCLITLDFADVTRFPPAKAGGIVVIRVPRNPSLSLLAELVHSFLRLAGKMSVEKKLWIVEVDRVRVHQTDAEEQ